MEGVVIPPEGKALTVSVILRNDMAAKIEGLIPQRNRSITSEKSGDKQQEVVYERRK
jgi:hypothetical protein